MSCDLSVFAISFKHKEINYFVDYENVKQHSGNIICSFAWKDLDFSTTSRSVNSRERRRWHIVAKLQVAATADCNPWHVIDTEPWLNIKEILSTPQC